MSEFLLEIFSEEIPARMQANAAAQLKKMLGELLAEKNITATSLETFATPRRLVAVVNGLPKELADRKEEKKGPRVGSPQQAIDGFLKSTGLSSIDKAEKRQTDKGEFYFHNLTIKGGKTAEILPQIIETLLAKFNWPKSMRWPQSQTTWIRPIRHILAIFDEKPLNGFSAKTTGHRFLAPEFFTVKDFADYQKKLAKAFVILSREERKIAIQKELEDTAKKLGLQVKPDIGLLEEVSGLIEWPSVVVGKIDQEFMDVPPEVLTATLRNNQKYFMLLNKDGSLSNQFLIVANVEAPDKGKAIVAGNERVVRARLYDAKFFWEKDKETGLKMLWANLGKISFHAKLGNMAQKTNRLEELAIAIAEQCKTDKASAKGAATLSKADLTSTLVGEFPELQGIIGSHLSKLEGSPKETSQALRDQYKPLGPDDAVPNTPASIAVALADKFDNLAGFFAIGEKPTGSGDPYALRRAALGVIRIILENKLSLSLRPLLVKSLELYKKQNLIGLNAEEEKKLLADLSAFFAERLRVYLEDKKSYRRDVILAALSSAAADDLYATAEKIAAFHQLYESETGKNLLAAYKRAANILKIEEEKDKKNYRDLPNKQLFSLDAETKLADALNGAVIQIGGNNNHKQSLENFAKVKEPLDHFFDKVMVNDNNPDIRANRLRLLGYIIDTFNKVADFSKIQA
ncbi:MAG: glycine--tRNA ligase subunit beta [Dongiaceae bacterium]